MILTQISLLHKPFDFSKKKEKHLSKTVFILIQNCIESFILVYFQQNVV